jgi:protein dithiol oxidoreductase (disulfide-forming)
MPAFRNSTRRTVLAWLAAGLSAFALSIAATPATAQFAEGRDYVRVDPPHPTDDSRKIEVIEFFWYGCGHCYKAEPHWNDWVKRVPADVTARKVPAMGGGWTDMGVMYYALEALGKLKELHPKIFAAIHDEGIPLQSPARRAEWLKANGVDMQTYEEVAKSFSVSSKINRAMQLNRAYKIESVPRFVVNGRFNAGVPLAQGYESTFTLVDQLIGKVRATKTSTAPAPVKGKPVKVANAKPSKVTPQQRKTLS